MIINHNQIVRFKEALYAGTCNQCNKRINWEADFDADGTTYHGMCCNKTYFMKPETVWIEVDPA